MMNVAVSGSVGLALVVGSVTGNEWVDFTVDWACCTRRACILVRS